MVSEQKSSKGLTELRYCPRNLPLINSFYFIAVPFVVVFSDFNEKCKYVFNRWLLSWYHPFFFHLVLGITQYTLYTHLEYLSYWFEGCQNITLLLIFSHLVTYLNLSHFWHFHLMFTSCRIFPQYLSISLSPPFL